MKAITFDAVGTLFGLASPVGVTYSRIARSHGWHLSATSLDHGFRAAWKAAPPIYPARLNDPPQDPDAVERDWWRSLVEDCFRKALNANGKGAVGFRLPDSLFAELFQHYGKPEAWSIYPEVEEVLERLMSRGPLAVISNFDRRFHRVIEGLGLARFFQAVILSGEVGCAKPAAFIFERAAEVLGVPPDQVLHVGDDPEADWLGGRAAGFQIFELARPKLTLRDLPFL